MPISGQQPPQKHYQFSFLMQADNQNVLQIKINHDKLRSNSLLHLKVRLHNYLNFSPRNPIAVPALPWGYQRPVKSSKKKKKKSSNKSVKNKRIKQDQQKKIVSEQIQIPQRISRIKSTQSLPHKPSKLVYTESQDSSLDCVVSKDDQLTQTITPIRISNPVQTKSACQENVCVQTFENYITREQHYRRLDLLREEMSEKVSQLQKNLIQLKEAVSSRKKKSKKQELTEFLSESATLFDDIQSKMKQKKSKQLQERMKLHNQLLFESTQIQVRQQQMLETQFIFQKAGISTNLHVLREYLLCLWKFVNNSYLTQLLQGIHDPRGPTIQTYLVTARNEQAENRGVGQTVPTLQDQIYNQFELNAIEPGVTEEEKTLKVLQHVHNKAIFDAFNEQLFKLKKPNSLLRFLQLEFSSDEGIIYEKQIQEMFQRALKQLLKCGQVLAGIHVNSLDESLRRLSVENMTEEHRGESIRLKHHRKQHMSKLIALDLCNEHKGLQEEQRKEWLLAVLETSQMVMDQLFVQFQLELLHVLH